MSRQTLNQLYERPQQGERAVLVAIDFNAGDFAAESAEFRELAGSAGVIEVAFVTGSRHKADAKLFIGSGKANEVCDVVLAEQAEVVIFDHELTPAQGRNLEKLFGCRVLDRTDLILDIFAQRARSFAGKLQVELAQLQHLATRLVRGWTHLERQRGGIGLRGPGETQLETDRRLLGTRIKAIKKRLEKVHSQREQGRRARRKAELPTISLVGYTNAGKSTLFNRLTSAGVFAENQLFATLDPTLRHLELPEVGKVIVADTVGFVRKLPHDLVEAFRATLEETKQADLLLHVVNCASNERREMVQAVEQVLTEIEADTVPCLQVYNKVDLLEGYEPRIDRDEQGNPYRVWLSALSGKGMDLLIAAIQELLSPTMIEKEIIIHPNQGKLYAKLKALNAIKQEKDLPTGGWQVKIVAPKKVFQRWLNLTQ